MCRDKVSINDDLTKNNDERRQTDEIRSPDNGGNRRIHPGKACHGVDIPRCERGKHVLQGRPDLHQRAR